ncbi:MAG: hypothetical protein KDA87_24655, partial [Planctomycetales bacterium]|nr:hypothetical protein [Planctomycetales bacterium]
MTMNLSGAFHNETEWNKEYTIRLSSFVEDASRPIVWDIVCPLKNPYVLDRSQLDIGQLVIGDSYTPWRVGLKVNDDVARIEAIQLDGFSINANQEVGEIVIAPDLDTLVEGEFRDFVYCIGTDRDGNSFLGTRLLITGAVVPDVQAFPNRVFWRENQGEQTIVISSRLGKLFSILDVECSDNGFSVNTEYNQAQVSHVLQLTRRRTKESETSGTC